MHQHILNCELFFFPMNTGIHVSLKLEAFKCEYKKLFRCRLQFWFVSSYPTHPRSLNMTNRLLIDWEPKEQIITRLNVQSNRANYCSKFYMAIIIKTKLYNVENPFKVLVAFFHGLFNLHNLIQQHAFMMFFCRSLSTNRYRTYLFEFQEINLKRFVTISRTTAKGNLEVTYRATRVLEINNK